MPGFVRSQDGATGWGLPLETSVLVLERDQTRVVLCGIDTLGLQSPEVDRLRHRVAATVDAEPVGVLLNCNHTHRAPPAARRFLLRSGLLVTDGDARYEEYADSLADQVVTATKDAAACLEPAGVAWGVGVAHNLSVNRRDRAPSGHVVHGWRADGALDRDVISLQARRPDGSAIATLVCFGCHTVTVGMDVPLYSSDFPGALRQYIRRFTGGEAVFFQGAGGNVNPLIAFGNDEIEAARMGERLALEAIHSLSDSRAWPVEVEIRTDASLVPMINFRVTTVRCEPPSLGAVEERVAFPLLPSPSRDEVLQMAAEYAAQVAAARDRSARAAELNGLLYHEKWARRLAEDLEETHAANTSVEGSVNAVRIGDGLIVTGPGEVFTEIGLAVRERAPGNPVMYCGYTNGAVGYLPTASAFAEGGYEPAFSNRSYGLPAPLAPDCERLLIETGVRLGESLFPDSARYSGSTWTYTGHPLPEYSVPRLSRPPYGDDEPPPTAPAPG